MFEKTIEASGINVSVTAKVFGEEVRIYQYRGDVSPEVQGEVAQILAADLGVSKVIFK